MTNAQLPETLTSPLPTEHSPRMEWADFCRVNAIFGVIVIHACGEFFYRYDKIPLTDWLGTNLLDSLVRCSVPLFVMLSGALILNSSSGPIGLARVTTRVAKVLVPLLTWSVIYLLYKSLYSPKAIDWFEGLFQPVMYHLWFVYMIVGLYLLLPVLAAVFELILPSKSLQIYLATVWVVLTVVPVFQTLPLLAVMQQSSLFGYGGYFILGGIVSARYRNCLGSPFWVAAYAIAASLTFYITWHLTEKSGSVNEIAYVYFSPTVVVSAVAAFMLFTRIKVAPRFSAILSKIADLSFLVFFMHTVVLERVQLISAKHLFPIGLPAPIAVLINASLTLILCLFFANLVRQLVPYSRKIAG